MDIFLKMSGVTNDIFETVFVNTWLHVRKLMLFCVYKYSVYNSLFNHSLSLQYSIYCFFSILSMTKIAFYVSSDIILLKELSQQIRALSYGTLKGFIRNCNELREAYETPSGPQIECDIIKRIPRWL